jgi:hypothetical protein
MGGLLPPGLLADMTVAANGQLGDLLVVAQEAARENRRVLEERPLGFDDGLVFAGAEGEKNAANEHPAETDDLAG